MSEWYGIACGSRALHLRTVVIAALITLGLDRQPSSKSWPARLGPTKPGQHSKEKGDGCQLQWLAGGSQEPATTHSAQPMSRQASLKLRSLQKSAWLPH